MNDTRPSYVDPDEERRLQGIDPDETIPPRRTTTQTSVEYPTPGFSPVSQEPPPGMAYAPVEYAPLEEPERIPTPRSFPPVPVTMSEPPPVRRASPLLGCLTGLALLLALLSLVVNVVLISTLLNVQRTAIQNVDAAIQALDDFSGEGFHYEYRFNQEVPVAASIPIQQQMTIPFAGNFPINTTIEVPIDAGLLGTFVVDVPINTSVYVDTEVPVNIDQTFELSTSIPISMTVPIDVGTEDPEIQGVLGKVQQWLIDLRDSLSTGFLPGWLPGEEE